MVRIFIYTAVYAAIVLIMDLIFNGTVIDYLYDRLPPKLFFLIWQNKGVTSLIVYIVGLVVVSVIHVFRLAKLLQTASAAVTQEALLSDKQNCPDELKDFSIRLTEFRQMLRANEAARKTAEQQKNDLIVYLAHDLKTPLTSVIGYLSLLEESPELNAEQRAKYIGIALEKAHRLEMLINEFFEITRLNLQTDAVHKESVNLTVLLLQVISEFYPMLENKGMSIQRNIASDLHINGDADKLARLFENLLRNAVNYSTADSVIQCSAVAGVKSAVIKFSNVGETIPPEKLEHLFDKFYRLDDARQSDTGGTGLGLAIAKQIVTLHGGNITATSNQNITEFTVILPL